MASGTKESSSFQEKLMKKAAEIDATLVEQNEKEKNELQQFTHEIESLTKTLIIEGKRVYSVLAELTGEISSVFQKTGIEQKFTERVNRNEAPRGTDAEYAKFYRYHSNCFHTLFPISPLQDFFRIGIFFGKNHRQYPAYYLVNENTDFGGFDSSPARVFSGKEIVPALNIDYLLSSYTDFSRGYSGRGEYDDFHDGRINFHDKIEFVKNFTKSLRTEYSSECIRQLYKKQIKDVINCMLNTNQNANDDDRDCACFKTEEYAFYSPAWYISPSERCNMINKKIAKNNKKLKKKQDDLKICSTPSLTSIIENVFKVEDVRRKTEKVTKKEKNDEKLKQIAVLKSKYAPLEQAIALEEKRIYDVLITCSDDANKILKKMAKESSDSVFNYDSLEKFFSQFLCDHDSWEDTEESLVIKQQKRIKKLFPVRAGFYEYEKKYSFYIPQSQWDNSPRRVGVRIIHLQKTFYLGMNPCSGLSLSNIHDCLHHKGEKYLFKPTILSCCTEREEGERGYDFNSYSFQGNLLKVMSQDYSKTIPLCFSRDINVLSSQYKQDMVYARYHNPFELSVFKKCKKDAEVSIHILTETLENLKEHDSEKIMNHYKIEFHKGVKRMFS